MRTSLLERTIQPIRARYDNAKLRQIGDKVLELEPGKYHDHNQRRIGSRTVLTTAYDTVQSRYEVVVGETARDTYSETTIQVSLPQGHYDPELPEVQAVRRTYNDGQNEPEQASYPPSSDDTPYCQLSLGAILRSLDGAVALQKPVIYCPVTQ